jgi:hypothetical protein
MEGREKEDGVYKYGGDTSDGMPRVTSPNLAAD